ncbi:hypothetical protein LEP1GSC202_1720 [Leptospira yanagawae serovar Saopaulo str. Sao Paulo = ATCC 700523]|uniref:Uncharacterized protein n=1 Tax=Leptospira yanagawae serovar Saopaulo str. Sao Paulo = ATCC 700523 TaxID=1249483 RepID=A0A5E8HGB7_9LEPT|nr:hypothetical protein LEP1GSC202_1720 [Leptospira yanagawae serovar Saopaulo str. Sao Paulo = ATCC 700523]
MDIGLSISDSLQLNELKISNIAKTKTLFRNKNYSWFANG